MGRAGSLHGVRVTASLLVWYVIYISINLLLKIKKKKKACLRVGPEGRQLRWFVHHSGGVECRGHAQDPVFAPGS